MKTVKAFYDGRVFVPVTPIKAKVNQVAIITILDGLDLVIDSKPFLKYAGALTHDDYSELVEILKDTERVDTNEW